MTKEEHLKKLGFNATQEQLAGGFIFNQQAYTFALEAMESYATDRLDSYKESLRADIEAMLKRLVAMQSLKSEDAQKYKCAHRYVMELYETLDTVTPKE